ncbi:uncharacterized protein BT62DRAFT_934482 [Guyanagaster necrorhizus]|uniref:F-box domain-containing protein n=1 Tax=Guyanagaster necrorhizus TaxID=856835 RepID=A0A9P8ARI6_9AGAR|nr:uncharacterized protein BT62DRAFT_934482 [Guyanagaster necrorhizus MCA 3950]KAG7443902.1 hypothetical protein BT62DRAFT_934482 [Guyanagaster necrorhizus MCA 3950]
MSIEKRISAASPSSITPQVWLESLHILFYISGWISCDSDFDHPPSFFVFNQNNEYPSDAEREKMKLVANNVLLALHSINVEIGASGQTSPEHQARLRGRGDRLNRIRDEYVEVLAPIRVLPPEILGEIFRLAVDLRIAYRVTDVPWKLSHVCRKWRCLALSDSHLWARIYIDNAKTSANRITRPILDAMLTRSGSQHLTVTYSEARHTGPSDLYLLERLLENSERWREVNLHFSASTIQRLQMLRYRLPKLSSLFLNPLDNSTGLPVIDFLRHSPSLESLTLDGFKASTRFIIGAANLVYFDDSRFGDVKIDELHAEYLGIIRCSPRLQRFHSIHWPNSSSTWRALSPPILHTSLTDISTRDSSFLQSLTLPSLTTVEAWPLTEPEDDNTSNDFAEALIQLLEKSRCSLTSLTINDIAVRDAGLWVKIFKLSPGLRDLDINFATLWNDDYPQNLQRVFHEMTAAGPGGHNLCPSLERFSFELDIKLLCEEVDVLVHGLKPMLLSRSPRATTSSSLSHVFVDIGVTEDELEKLDEILFYVRDLTELCEKNCDWSVNICWD